MIKQTFVGLLIVLVLVIVYQYYKISEGFDDLIAATTTSATPPATTIAATAPTTPATSPTVVTATPTPVSPSTDLPTEIAKEKLDRANLLRDIQQIVHNELLEQQKMTTASSQPILNSGITSQGPISPAMAQGQELSTKREKNCPKDMNEYIRKDSIPCWNCTLDY